MPVCGRACDRSAGGRGRAAQTGRIIMIVNGQQETLDTPISVTELIEQRGLRPERVAVELNGDIVPRNKRSEVMLHDGDTVEIVTFVQGG